MRSSKAMVLSSSTRSTSMPIVFRLGEVLEIRVDIRQDDQRANEVIRRMRSLLSRQEVTPQAATLRRQYRRYLSY
jgi:hypothetical protein